MLKCFLCGRSSARGRDYTKPVAVNTTEDEELNQKFDEYKSDAYSDVDCSADRGDRSARSKPCPSPATSDDCCDPCRTSSARRGGRSPSDDRAGSGRPSRSPGSGRKPTRSTSETCDECASIGASPRNPSTRRQRTNVCNDCTPSCPPRNPCSDLWLDCSKAPSKRPRTGGSEQDFQAETRSLSRTRATSEASYLERRSSREAPDSRRVSRQGSVLSRGDDDCDGVADNRLERCRDSADHCCDRQERDCDSESR